MRKLTWENTAAAVKRAYVRKPKVRMAYDEAGKPRFTGKRGVFHIICDKGHTHTAVIERRMDGLYGDCYFEPTGEVCPAELGKKVCYHLPAAVKGFELWTAIWEERSNAWRAQHPEPRYTTRVIGGQKKEFVRGIQL